MRLDDFFIDEPMTEPNPPATSNAQRDVQSTVLPSSSSPVDKMRLCIELLNDIACWTTSAARKPIEETINQLSAMLKSIGGI